MSKEREALKLALELLDKQWQCTQVWSLEEAQDVADNIRAALAEQPAQHDDSPHPEYCKGYAAGLEAGSISEKKPAQQEPVDSIEKAGAFMEAKLWEFIDMAAAWPEAKPDARTWAHVMAYAPQSKPWQGLTDEEKADIADQWATDELPDIESVIDEVAAKLREKNAQPSKPLTDEQWQQIAAITGCVRIEKRGRDAILRVLQEAAHGIKGDA